MVWKRIMNNKQDSANVFGDKKEKTSEESEQGREKLQTFLTDMVMEWNLRLFLETENSMGTEENEMTVFYPRSVLWVEKATVTAYDVCPGINMQRGLTGNRKQGLAGYIKNCLIGMRNFRILKR